MNDVVTMLRKPTRARATMAVALVAACALAGCASSGGSKGGGAKGLGPATVASSGCGSLPGAAPSDPDGALAKLPSSVQSAYQGSSDPVLASAWQNTKPVKGPWKIGLTMIPITGPTAQAFKTEFEKRFTEAKAAGQVTGSLQELIMPDPTAPTAAQQIQEYQSLVRSGVNGIVLQPFAPPAMVSAVDAAGKAGVVTASMSPIASKYAVSAQASFYQLAGLPAAAILKQLKGKGNVLIVRGIPGVAPDTEGYKAIQAALKECPGVKVVGQVTAQFSDSSAKSAVQTYLAAHPGKIDAVLQVAAMATGALNAFVSSGRPVPLIEGTGATAGFYSYWAKHKDTFSTAAVVGPPAQMADAVWDSMIRTLSGKGPKVSIIDASPTLVNNDNMAKFVVAGQPVTSEVLQPSVASVPFMKPNYLDQFFGQSGN